MIEGIAVRTPASDTAAGRRGRRTADVPALVAGARDGDARSVARLISLVEDEVDDAVAGVLPADRVSGHQMASTTVAMPMPPPTQSVASP